MTGILGWELTGLTLGDEVYPVGGRGAARWCGFVDLPSNRGLPNHWLPYLSVPDLETACASVIALGGSVLTGREETPGFGGYAVCEGPDRCWFAVHQGTPAVGAHPVGPAQGGSPWGALVVAPEPTQCAEFFRGLLGWTTSASPLGPRVALSGRQQNGQPTNLWIIGRDPESTPDFQGHADQASWIPIFLGPSADPLHTKAMVHTNWPGTDTPCVHGNGLPPFLIRDPLSTAQDPLGA